MKYEIYSTEKFKAGDLVWFSDIQFYPSGRLKTKIDPVQVKIKKVYPDKIELGLENIKGIGYYSYRYNNIYYVRSINYSNYALGPSSINYDVGLHISETKEESMKKFNYLIERMIEQEYEKFKRFEMSLKSWII